MQTFNFNLEFGNKNVVIRFNDSNKMHVVGENAPWESIPYMNAVSHLMNVEAPLYEVMDEGLYLHHDLMTIANGMPSKNVGYATHPVVKQMVETALLRRDLELKPGIYRLKWNGLFLTAEDLPFRVYDPNESAQVGHDRDAFQLIMAFETMRKAIAGGFNIRLLTSEKLQKRVDFLKAVHALFVAGDYAGVAAKIKGGVDRKATYDTLRDYSKRSANAVTQGKGFELPETVAVIGNDAVPTPEMIGKAIHFVSNGTTLPVEYTVTEGQTDLEKSLLNVGDMVASAKARNLKIFVVSKEEAAADEQAPVAAKAPRKSSRKARVNVPVEITE